MDGKSDADLIGYWPYLADNGTLLTKYKEIGRKYRGRKCRMPYHVWLKNTRMQSS
jgi:hypothetical protein